MRILITGGLGFIGTHTAASLAGLGHEIVLYDNLSAQIHGAVPTLDLRLLESLRATIIRGDVSNPDDLAEALRGAEAVVHLAAETGTAQSMYQIGHYSRVNVQGTANLLDTLQRMSQRPKVVVLASSRAVYGEGAYRCGACDTDANLYPSPRRREELDKHHWDHSCAKCQGPLTPVGTPEHASIRPASVYAATKYFQEELLRIASQTLGTGSVVLRLQNVYGEGQSLKNPYTGILSIFSNRIRLGKSLPIFEDGMESRDFVHVSDVVRAISLALSLGRRDHEVFNVGTGRPISILEVARKLNALMGGRIAPHLTAEYRLGDIRHCFAELSRANGILGFDPKVTIEEGLAKFVAWVLKQPLEGDNLDVANDELRRKKLMS